MVLLTISPSILEALETYNRLIGHLESKNHEPALSHPSVGESISHGQLIELSNGLKQWQKEQGIVSHAFSLDTLLRGARIHVPPPKPRAEKSPEYVRLMARLREEEQRRQYERMINPPPSQETFQRRYPGASTFGATLTSGPDSIDLDEVTYADINRQMTLIINVLVTIIACSVGIWITAWHWPTPARLGLSMGGSAVVAAAEVAIYLGYIRRVTDAKVKERRTVESKEIVETWVLDGNGHAKGQTKGYTKGHAKGHAKDHHKDHATGAIHASSNRQLHGDGLRHRKGSSR